MGAGLQLRHDLGHSNRGVQKEYLIALLLQEPELFMAMLKTDREVRFSKLSKQKKRWKRERSPRRLVDRKARGTKGSVYESR